MWIFLLMSCFFLIGGPVIIKMRSKEERLLPPPPPEVIIFTKFHNIGQKMLLMLLHQSRLLSISGQSLRNHAINIISGAFCGTI